MCFLACGAQFQSEPYWLLGLRLVGWHLDSCTAGLIRVGYISTVKPVYEGVSQNVNKPKLLHIFETKRLHITDKRSTLSLVLLGVINIGWSYMYHIDREDMNHNKRLDHTLWKRKKIIFLFQIRMFIFHIYRYTTQWQQRN